MKSKNIIIISLNYYPEDTAIGLYSTQMAEYLNSKNWNVTVITGFPYYPKWEIADNYKNKKTYYEEVINEIKIYRYKQFVPSKPNFTKRILHILDFTLGSLFNIKKIKQADIVLSVIPFTSSAWLGKKLAKRSGAKHWIHIQDFEFDVAMNSGIIADNVIGKFLTINIFKLESKILDSANLLSTISNGMINKLKNKSKTETNYFPNWVDQKMINPSKYEQHKYLKSNKFKVLYSGNIGDKQDWAIFVKIAEKLKYKKNIEFIIVGSGSKKKELIRATNNFNNVIHYEPVAYKELNDLLCSADLHILFQKEYIIDVVMPSKILGMMASAKPSLITGNLRSEIAEAFKNSKSGSFYKSSDIIEIEAAIIRYSTDNDLCFSTGKNSRDYIISKFSKEKVLGNFNKKLESLISEK